MGLFSLKTFIITLNEKLSGTNDNRRIVFNHDDNSETRHDFRKENLRIARAFIYSFAFILIT